MTISRVSWWLALSSAWLLGCAHAPRSKHEVDRAEVYTAVDGMRVELLLLKGAGDRCLVRVVSQPATSYSGHVFDCVRASVRGVTTHRAQLDGQQRTLLEQGSSFARTWPPDERDPRSLKLDPVATQALDVRAMLESNALETENGVLAKLAAVDRPGRLAESERDLAAAATRANAACGVDLKVTNDFQTAPDDVLLASGLGSVCAEVFDGIRALCEAVPVARDFFRTEVTAVHCAVGTDREAPSQYALDAHTLRYTQNGRPSNVQANTILFLDGVGSSGKPAAAPWGDGSSLRNRLVLATTHVCADAAGHVVALDPRVGTSSQDMTRGTLFSGTTAQVSLVPSFNRYVEDFFEPRYPRKARPPGEWYRSFVAVDQARQECTITCGSREVRVPRLSPDAATKLLLGAKVVAAPFSRKAHALLRDTSGAYYYVDTSTLPDREKDFQVWVGQRGRMKKQQLVNALSDSAGDLFTTKSGALRLSLDREQPSFWQEGKAKRPLRVVPLDENLDVVFLELGVYAGARLGTPCDDF